MREHFKERRRTGKQTRESTKTKYTRKEGNEVQVGNTQGQEVFATRDKDEHAKIKQKMVTDNWKQVEKKAGKKGQYFHILRASHDEFMIMNTNSDTQQWKGNALWSR